MTNTASDFGKELDSLADVITFGVAPSLLAYIWGFRMLPAMEHPELRGQIVHVGVFVCFMFLICGASRLARFNISINPQPRNPGRPGKKYFVGMPIPAGAGVISSVIHLCSGARRSQSVDGAGVAVPDSVYGISDGEQVAILEREGDHVRQAASVPDGCGACGDRCADCVVSPVHADHHCVGVSGFGRGGAAGVLVEQGAASIDGCESAIEVSSVRSWCVAALQRTLRNRWRTYVSNRSCRSIVAGWQRVER